MLNCWILDPKRRWSVEIWYEEKPIRPVRIDDEVYNGEILIRFEEVTSVPEVRNTERCEVWQERLEILRGETWSERLEILRGVKSE